MKYSIACFFFMILFLPFAKAQDINWQTAQHWRLYKIPVRTGFSVSTDSLSSFKSIELDTDKMKTFLAEAHPISTESYAWMGLYVASYELKDQKRRKILFSTYGGFFYDETTDKYFQVTQEVRNQWLQYLKENSIKIK